MNLKLIGGILLIVGTSVGGGMLALPISAAPGGFMSSSLLLLGCWAIMTFCAFLILEVNLWFPEGSNLISMARGTLGRGGAWLAWVAYLLLFYCLLAAYTSSGSDMLRHAANFLGITSPAIINTLLYIGILGFVVFLGVKSVDYLNRFLIAALFMVFFILLACLILYVDPMKLIAGTERPRYLIGAITIALTSFGFAVIIPSLRTYFNGNVTQLRWTVGMGSLIPLIFYIVWNTVILGIVPQEGEYGLISMLTSGHSTTDLPTALSHHLENDWISLLARIFAALAIATSFLGVALATSDFLADGLKIHKKGRGNLVIFGATFFLPLAMTLFYPNAFILGLHYAGICCTILLILYPAFMVWSGRYYKKLATGYQVIGGKTALMVIILLGLAITVLGWLQDVNGMKF